MVLRPQTPETNHRPRVRRTVRLVVEVGVLCVLAAGLLVLPQPDTSAAAGAKLVGPERHRVTGHRMMRRAGWPERQWPALNKLWTKESGWRKRADNPTSSAYGIPQALTVLHGLEGTKYMTSARAQIRWGLDYIKDRYRTPRRAWRHSKRHGWY